MGRRGNTDQCLVVGIELRTYSKTNPRFIILSRIPLSTSDIAYSIQYKRYNSLKSSLFLKPPCVRGIT